MGESAVQNRELSLVFFDDPDRWDGEGNGREFQKGGDICKPMADSF